MLKKPVYKLNNHCVAVSGDMLAKGPKYSAIITWKTTVAATTLTKTVFFQRPSKTFPFSIFRELTMFVTPPKSHTRSTTAWRRD
ncbi:hypothetical protein Hanom_Chr00s000001g01595331 [Helianthus anomalus]